MSETRPMKMIRLTLAALVAVLVSACATQPRGPAAPAAEIPVEERAVQRWQHLIDGNPDLAWNMLTPGARSAKPREKYAEEMRDRPVRWTKVTFRDKECDQPDACNVRVNVEYRVMVPVVRVGEMTVPSTLVERWLRLDGQWYHLPDEYDAGGLR
jgi:hypothetical protein